MAIISAYLLIVLILFRIILQTGNYLITSSEQHTCLLSYILLGARYSFALRAPSSLTKCPVCRYIIATTHK